MTVMPSAGAKDSVLVAVSIGPSFNYTSQKKDAIAGYNLFQIIDNAVATAEHTFFNGQPAYLLDKTTQPSCMGDEAGIGGGVKSGTVGGEVKPTSGSSTVFVEGKALIREGDTCTMNNGNVQGVYKTVNASWVYEKLAALEKEEAVLFAGPIILFPPRMTKEEMDENIQKIKQTSWAAWNPIDAYKIGTGTDNDNDISSVAAKYSVRGRAPGAGNTSILSSENDVKGKSGGINALRHVLWQALITKEIGLEEAKQIGNIHEGLDMSTPSPIYNPNERFGSYDEADSRADQLNNVIGRKIGSSISSNASRQQVVTKAIDQWSTKPFYLTDKNSAGQFIVKPVVLSQDNYEAYKGILPKLDDNGNWK